MKHGWVLVDKPEGISFAHVVAKIKRLFKAKKAGHGGTHHHSLPKKESEFWRLYESILG